MGPGRGGLNSRNQGFPLSGVGEADVVGGEKAAGRRSAGSGANRLPVGLPQRTGTSDPRYLSQHCSCTKKGTGWKGV